MTEFHRVRTLLEREVEMLGDPELKKVKAGDIIQLQRQGYFRVDVAYKSADVHTNKEQPVILFHVPDGHAKENISGKGKPKAEVKKDAIAEKKIRK